MAQNGDNLITDVPGVRIGNAHDDALLSGVSVIVPPSGTVGAVDVRGGGPGTRETDALALSGSVNVVHGVVLSGGSAFGLNAAGGVQSWLAAQGIGLNVGGNRIPIVPQAILFDLSNGGNKAWGSRAPYEDLALAACDNLVDGVFEIGSAGAGFGASTANLRGGLGSASLHIEHGLTIGAVVAVNSLGSATMGAGPHFWAHALERTDEFGGRGGPLDWSGTTYPPMLKTGPSQNTTIGVVATNARLNKSQTQRIAVMAQAGLARALWPVHAPLDGDVVFALSTGEVPIEGGGDIVDDLSTVTILGTAAADVMARAIARGVFSAASCPGHWKGPPAYRDVF